MAIYYRYFYRPYKDVPMAELDAAVSAFSTAMTAYRKRELSTVEFLEAKRKHFEKYECVSVKEVFSRNTELKKQAEYLVNRNEMLLRNYMMIEKCVLTYGTREPPPDCPMPEVD